MNLPRLFVAITCLVPATWLYLKVIRDSRKLRRAGVNSDIAYAYESLRRTGLLGIWIFGLYGFSAIRYRAGGERGWLFISVLIVAIYIARSLITQRQAEARAAEEIQKRQAGRET